jgi:hypothetical protein
VKTLSRIIIAYAGLVFFWFYWFMLFNIKWFIPANRSVSSYISDEVDFVVTDKKWNKDFDKVSPGLNL